MKRWQLTLMTVVLLTLALVPFMGVSALLLVQDQLCGPAAGPNSAGPNSSVSRQPM
jgi:hypothetical protein